MTQSNTVVRSITTLIASLAIASCAAGNSPSRRASVAYEGSRAKAPAYSARPAAPAYSARPAGSHVDVATGASADRDEGEAVSAPRPSTAPRTRASAEAPARKAKRASLSVRPASVGGAADATVISVPPSAGAAYRPPPRPVPVQVRPARVKRLTAASVGDLDRFDNYLSYLGRHSRERREMGVAMNRRVRLRVVDAAGSPINDAALTVATSNQRIVQGRTHADGRWDFFPSFSAPGATGHATVTVSAGSKRATIRVTLPAHGTTSEILVQLQGTRALRPKTLDLAFAIDVTGSMGDELRYVNSEVADIVQRIRASVPNTRVRVGAVFYKDRQDAQRLQMLQFTTDVAGFGRAMRRVSAGGGGDYPEDMDAGLGLALRNLSWSRGNAARVLVVLADAPPKRYANATYRYPQAMADASKMGIRLLPVAASGADRRVEYIFRAMGALTSTPYVYLTDDSGIGGHHVEADTDRVGVEKFNDLLTRLVISDLQGKGMHEPGTLGPQ